ncbi:MAG: hypothetical protein K9N46_06655 [Candidatus Marinimicrobia bacterium]|nr:hypothetical protein [Candidatus Neomarinimicrobiota bacterium]MCF7828660.1 hypothetical protein [Candidatus Neomarinimicrobiota bacterium]MCF7880401.1 hypothetical protein [Candidatus Neomarinimicrobiota bacterium]
MKNLFIIPLVFALCTIFIDPVNAAQEPADAGKCMACHKEKSPGLYNQWFESAHGQQNVTCISCHGAKKSDSDAFMHEGALIATLVTPKDCGSCHKKEAEEVANSYHATAGEILESKDAYLAQVIGGHPVTITGCESCHGAKIEVDPDSPNMLSKEDWPNSGIGRINPDGSKGSCNACHMRHSFSKAQARQPEACSKCHLGPDHPQKEIYEASKHGNTYFTNVDKMNLDSDRWVVGQDYNIAPTCATCHMSATTEQNVTHDVGKRISWTLRPEISVHKDNWKKKRDSMKDVCSSCHENEFVDGHYYQYDAVVKLYNKKFAEPAQEIMYMIQDKGLLENPASFSNEIEWIYWELWHHEGRRARMGAAMMAPDYTWWHGIYEVGKHFYFEFLPLAREYEDSEVDAYIDSLLEENPMHTWMNQSTKSLKESIRTGDQQNIYNEMFQSE